MSNLERLQLNDATISNVNFVSNQLEVEVNDTSTLELCGTSEVLNVNINDAGKVNGFFIYNRDFEYIF